MALQDILTQIAKEIDEKIKELNKEAEDEIKKIKEQCERQKEETKKDLEEKTAKNIKKIEEKTKILAKMEARNKLLHIKRKILDEAFQQAMDKIENSDKYIDLTTELLKKIAKEFEEGIVIPAKGKKEATKIAIQKAKVKFKLAEKEADIAGGFIFTSGDKIEIDNSLESIVQKQIRPDIEPDVAKVLF